MTNSNEWTPEKLQEVRQTALAIAERAKTDEDFTQKIKADPIAALTEAGLPREAVGNFLRDTQIVDDSSFSDEVSGYTTICIGSVVVG